MIMPTINQHTTHTHEPFLPLTSISKGYKLVIRDPRWCIGIGVWKWGKGASIGQVGSDQMQKNAWKSIFWKNSKSQ